MNTQEIFDTVARHLLTQNQDCVGEDGALYHGEGNLRCAIGCLIPDALYAPSIENIAVDGITGILGDKEATVPADVLRIRDHFKALIAPEEWERACTLMDRLQRVHDIGEVRDWPENLWRTAYGMELSTAVVEQMRPELFANEKLNEFRVRFAEKKKAEEAQYAPDVGCAAAEEAPSA